MSWQSFGLLYELIFMRKTGRGEGGGKEGETLPSERWEITLNVLDSTISCVVVLRYLTSLHFDHTFAKRVRRRCPS